MLMNKVLEFKKSEIESIGSIMERDFKTDQFICVAYNPESESFYTFIPDHLLDINFVYMLQILKDRRLAVEP